MGFLATLLMTLLMCLGLLMIFVVLLQRGRGGGLAGAFGGMGGQSAFGTKAGDVFTKITVVIAIVWVVLAAISGLVVRAAVETPVEGDFADDVPTMRGAEGDEPSVGDEEGGAPPVEPVTPGTDDESDEDPEAGTSTKGGGEGTDDPAAATENTDPPADESDPGKPVSSDDTPTEDAPDDPTDETGDAPKESKSADEPSRKEKPADDDGETTPSE